MAGLLSSMGVDPGFTNWWDSRRNAITQFGAGLARGDDFGEGIALGAQGAAQGRVADDAYATSQKEKTDREALLAAAIENIRTKYNRPEIADWLTATGADGLDAAWNEVLTGMKPKPEPDYPTSYDEFLLGQQNPEYAATLNQPGQVINNNIGGTDKFYDELDKGLAGQTTAAIESGMNAQSNNIRLGQLETLLQSAPQGAQGAMVQVAGSLGIPVEGLDDVQAAQALINQMVPGQRPPGSGTMSDADLALFKQSLPQIINQPGGNQLILQTMKAINEYTIAQALIAQKVANREISPAEGRSLQAQVPNPLASLPKPTMAPAQPRLRYNPATGDFE